jgi:hypothetical protein
MDMSETALSMAATAHNHDLKTQPSKKDKADE